MQLLIQRVEKDFEYYLNNKSELSKKFGDSFVIIQNQNILRSLPSFKEAMNYVVSQKGNFLIQELNDKADAQTAMFSL